MNKLANEIKRILRNTILLLNYRLWGRAVSPMIICMIDGRIHHGGLADRIKQILGIYAFCKINDYKFGLIANFPFELSNYLKPNYDWRVSEDSFSRSILWAHPVYLGNCSLDQQKSLLKLKRRQIHVYTDTCCSIFIDAGGFNQGRLFDELFIPIPEIVEFKNQYRLQFKLWDCLVFRFQNLLGDFYEPMKFQFVKIKLTGIEQEQLLDKCYQFVIGESLKTSHHLLVCSDSILFLKKVSSIPNVIIVPGELTHMAFTIKDDFKLHLKSFLDFFLISESETVCAVGTSVMYPSGFAKVAAAIKDVKFKRVLLE